MLNSKSQAGTESQKSTEADATTSSSHNAKHNVSSSGEAELIVMAQCDECGRYIMSDEVALARYGIMCYDCCKKMWGMD